ncbi:MAG TPA: hypothetical protein VMT02_01025 [Burkholderiales bacterium]|nr:hypothetical protein [Burkholderiales bacterium]
MKTRKRIALALALALPAIALPGCYVVPVAPDGTPLYVAPAPAPASRPGAPSAAFPAVMQARLYPANEAASRIGPLSGTVTNMMNGKGRLQLVYKNEVMIGEATRVADDERRGVASASGSSGAYMSCEYQMRTPVQGTGICSFSDGARYQVHIGG